MNKSVRRIGPVLLAGGLGLVSVLAGVGPASAATSQIALTCQAKPPIGGTQILDLASDFDGQAPATVTSGSTFDVVLAAGALTLPTTAGGFPINNVKNVKLKLPVPAGAAFQKASIAGGSNLGAGVPTVAQANGSVTLTVPGPIAGGATFQLPAVTLSLTATGAAGSTISTQLAGTSYTDPGLTLTANVKAVILNIDVPTNCFANPNPILTSTAVVSS